MSCEIEVVHANVLELGLDVFDGFDALITDPPYSPHVHESAVSVSTQAARGANGLGVREREFGFDALSPQLRMFLAEGMTRVKRWSAVFTDLQSASAWDAVADAAGAELIRWVPWIRWSQPQLSGDRPPSGAEMVCLYHAQNVGARGGRSPIATHWNGAGSLTHFNRRAMRGKDKHPTEKPIDLMLDLVLAFTDPGETVIDPCGGYGTTGLACRLLGRSCVVIEADKLSAAHATARVRSPLSPRDRVRVEEWCVSVHEEASSVPAPVAEDGSDAKTFERAQRRIAGVQQVMGEL